MTSVSEFVLGHLDHIQNVGRIFPGSEIFADKVNAIDLRRGEGRQGIIPGNGDDLGGEDCRGPDFFQYPICQGLVILNKCLDRPSASLNSNFHVVHFL